MKTAKSSKRTPRQISPLRVALDTMWAEAKAAAQKLGFDTSREDSMKLVSEESNSYPYTGDGEECLNLLPKQGLARMRGLELVSYWTDLAKNIEFHVQECDKWRADLRTVIAAHPMPMPLLTYIKQIEEREVA
jgi:hypothetical protein